MTRNEMTEQELDALADAMVKKAGFGFGFVDGRFHGRPGDEAESFRDFVKNVIVDTEMVVSGAVPLERWLDDS